MQHFMLYSILPRTCIAIVMLKGISLHTGVSGVAIVSFPGTSKNFPKGHA